MLKILTVYAISFMLLMPNVSYDKMNQNNKKLQRELTCLAKTVYFEARGEPYIGKKAVAQVTLNRTKSEHFPDDICSVVYEKRTKRTCQYSWVCMKNLKIKDDAAYQESYRASLEVISGKKVAKLEKSLFFHSVKVKPKWKNLKLDATIGDHRFYSIKQS